MEPFYAQARDRQRAREEREREEYDRGRRQRLEESYRQSRATGSGSVWDHDAQTRYGTDWSAHFEREQAAPKGSGKGNDPVTATNDEYEHRPWRQDRPDPYSGHQDRGRYDSSRTDRAGHRRHLWLKYGGDPSDRSLR